MRISDWSSDVCSSDLIAYRIAKAGAVAAVTDDAGSAKIDSITSSLPSLKTKIVASRRGGGERPGWIDLAKATDGVGGIVLPNEPTTRTDPLVVFFTSGTVSFPKMVLHDQSYALGHVATARFWHDLRPGDRHWTVSDTGWAKAEWGGLFGQ